ncbi:sugar transferase [Ellagibacter isourolithinifaciens]|uniref:sugar transferase n=1 Tax=Ellagibacter isourolithinifaciens TaxID=2137581 RepID=UPI003A90295E
MFFVLTKGMSLIGPRPERPAFCTEFEKHIHGWHYRTMVTPGLSGLAQVTGGYDLLPKEKVVLDLWRGAVPPAEPVEADAAALGQDLRTSTWLRSQPPFCWDWRTSQQ